MITMNEKKSDQKKVTHLFSTVSLDLKAPLLYIHLYLRNSNAFLNVLTRKKGKKSSTICLSLTYAFNNTFLYTHVSSYVV